MYNYVYYLNCVFYIHHAQYKYKNKGKAKEIPLHTWTGPEGSRRFRLPDFKAFGTWRW